MKPADLTPKPFLRWAGGKKWLVEQVGELIEGVELNRYHEPFVGGGAIFFNLEGFDKYFISDVNESLINTYRQVRDNVEKVIESMERYQNTKEYYYKLRAEVFLDNIESAAQFIYLNQTSFNGIFRVNLQGKYNVPYGRRTKNFLEPEVLRSASKKLSGVSITCRDFSKTGKNVKSGDLVFIDPPYTITHNNNGFIKYNENLFSLNDQRRLAEFVRGIIRAGAYYVMTSAAHEKIKEIFNFCEPFKLERASLVGGVGAQRGHYEEYVFTNLRS
jgi:DNA adenine methylase